jgi:hypothetical protein
MNKRQAFLLHVCLRDVAAVTGIGAALSLTMLGVAFFRTGVAHKVIVSMSWIPIVIGIWRRLT